MSATLLQIVQQATGEMGLSIPPSVSGNTAADVQQLMYLTNAVGYELAREYPWEALNTEYRFFSQYVQSQGVALVDNATLTMPDSTAANFMNTLGATNFQVQGIGVMQDTYVVSASGTSITLSRPCTQSGTGTFTFGQTKYPLPSGFDRITDRTQYDKSKRWEMLGPETPQQWQFLKSSYISTGPRIRWRIMGQEFQIWPLTSTNEYLGFEYITSYWAASASGTLKPEMTQDTDTCIFPLRLMVLGVKKKYFEIKGFDTTAFERDFQMQLNIAKANDQGSPTLSLAPRTANVLIGWENIPDANYGA